MNADNVELKVNLPAEMAPYKAELEYFFTIMVRKLYTNRHKGFSKDFDLTMLRRGLNSEVSELEEAIREKGQFEVSIEAADVANFGFLVSLAALHMDRSTFDKSRDEPPEHTSKTTPPMPCAPSHDSHMTER